MLGFAVAVGLAACAFLVAVVVGQGLVRASLWAAVLGGLAGVVAAVTAVWAVVPRPSKVLLPSELEVPEWVVERPGEMTAVVAALVGGRGGTVGITTGLYGAGGFGKTTLAQMVCADGRVRRRFGGRVYLVTVGRDVRGAAAVAAKVNDVIKLVGGEDVTATFTDPELAGRRLGSLLDAGPRRLLVLDDVWEPGQLAPFAEGGRRCARLVTTRVPGLLAGRGTAVRVDQMSPEQARALLTSGLPPLDPAVVQGLLAVTGRWPLLVRLVSKILADYARMAPDVSAKGAVLLERLRAGGPAVVDDLLGDAGRGLDVGKPQERALAVRATIGASTSLLDRQDAERFAELGVFAEDEAIPFGLVARLWRATAGLDDLQTAQVCKRLVQLALVSDAGPGGGITLHDVVRDFLRAELGQRLAGLNEMLLDAVAAGLPAAAASPLDAAAGRPVRVAWWDLGRADRYLWDHLIEHLLEAGRLAEADALAGDLRWVEARLERFGPAAPAADLSVVGSPRTARLGAALARVAHLLAPTEPAEAVVDVLHSRVADDPDWGAQVTALRPIGPRPRLVNRWPLPDLPDSALRRVLTGHTGSVGAVAVAPDGSWLASGGDDDGTVRIWDAATGQARATLKGHTLAVTAVAVAPDGSWLASGGGDRRVRIWDAATGQARTTLKGHAGPVEAVAVAPDGSWLASGSWDGTVRIWDVATGQARATLKGHTALVGAVAVAPDGSWLASGGDDGTVRIWDVATGQARATLEGHTDQVTAVAVAPDGSWLASGSWDGTVRIWDAATGQARATLEGRTGPVGAVAVAPDGSWLASGSWDRTVRIWDAATGQARATLEGRTGPVGAVAVAPDGSWLAAGDDDGTVRIWDAATGQARATLESRTGPVEAVAVAPDGSWLAAGDDDGTVRIWDAATGQARTTLKGHSERVTAVAVAPDGSWLASGSRDGTVRIWDAATGQARTTLKGHTGPVTAVAVAPDGSWLASGGDDRRVRIWDAATGQARTTLEGRTDQVTAVAVAPDGSWLASGSWDGTVRIWDAATGQARTTLKAHTGWPRRVAVAVAVAPDGSWLASGGDDGTVRIWDAATGQARTTMKGRTGPVGAVAVAPDGSWLASGGRDGTVRIWDAATGQARALMRVDNGINACAWVGTSGLAVGGPAGLYLFDFIVGTPWPPPGTDKDDGGSERP